MGIYWVEEKGAGTGRLTTGGAGWGDTRIWATIGWRGEEGLTNVHGAGAGKNQLKPRLQRTCQAPKYLSHASKAKRIAGHVE